MMNYRLTITLTLLFGLLTGSCDILARFGIGAQSDDYPEFDPRPFGSLGSSAYTLNNSKMTACEHPWTVRINIYHPTPRTMRRSYDAACTAGDDAVKYFTSLTVTDGVNENGVIIESTLTPSTGTFSDVKEHHYTECEEMHGIAVSEQCGDNLAALCRRPVRASESSPFKKDMVAALDNSSTRDWLTQPDNQALLDSSGSGNSYVENDEMWLYEFNNADPSTLPDRYVTHKAIGGWEYGNNYLLYAEDDNTYGIAVKSTVFDPNGGGHEADAFLIVDRNNYNIDLSRGYSWACGFGHTIMNRPGYNPVTGRYAMLCTTDGNETSDNNQGGLFFRPEDGSHKDFYRVYMGNTNILIKGGNGALKPLKDGGYLGIIVSNRDVTASIDDGFRGGEPTKIGLVEFDENGNVEGGIRWVAEMPGVFLSFPQLVELGDQSFVLGYAAMRDISGVSDFEDNTEDEFYRIASAYYLMEVDKYGNVIAPATQVDHGWGEQNQLVSAGYGRVAWSYMPDATIKADGSYASCNSTALEMNVYSSTIADGAALP